MKSIPTETIELPVLNIGATILQDLENQHLSVAWLSKELDIGRASVYYQLNTNHFELELLYRISVLMKHNYLAEYSNALNKEISRLKRKRQPK